METILPCATLILNAGAVTKVPIDDAPLKPPFIKSPEFHDRVTVRVVGDTIEV